jgi:hypothetical protein
MFSAFSKVAGKSKLKLPAPATLESRRPFSSDFRKNTGSVPATLENTLAKLASDFSEKRANSKVTGKM